MCGCKRSRTVRSSIRMCWYHMFSEDSTGKDEEPGPSILTVGSRVFDGCAQKFICDIKNTCEDIVLGRQQRTTR